MKTKATFLPLVRLIKRLGMAGLSSKKMSERGTRHGAWSQLMPLSALREMNGLWDPSEQERVS